MTDYITGFTREQLEARRQKLNDYCREQLEHTGPGESPWTREIQEELEQLRRYFAEGIHKLTPAELEAAYTPNQSLTEIATKHGSDKASFHGYTDIYARYFDPLRDKLINLLEIGIAGGASLRTWLEYFPRAEIIGVDHNPAACVDFGERCVSINGDVTDATLWKKLVDGSWVFDIIIDDGGHFSHQIIPAFEGGWPLLKPGGLYVIEDLHAIYCNEIAHDPAGKTAFDYFHNLMHEMNERGDHQCGKPSSSDIEWMHFSKSLVIIKKR